MSLYIIQNEAMRSLQAQQEVVGMHTVLNFCRLYFCQMHLSNALALTEGLVCGCCRTVTTFTNELIMSVVLFIRLKYSFSLFNVGWAKRQEEKNGLPALVLPMGIFSDEKQCETVLLFQMVMSTNSKCCPFSRPFMRNVLVETN